MNHEYTISGERLTLRPLCEGDIESLRQWRNKEENYRYIAHRGNISPEQQKSWFDGYLVREGQIIWAIVEKQSERLLGSVSIYDIDRQKKIGEFGGLMLGEPSARGKGYGYEAALLCLRAGFELLSLERIIGTVHTCNIAAICIYSRLGHIINGVQHFSGGTEGTEFTFYMEKERFEKLHSNENTM